MRAILVSIIVYLLAGTAAAAPPSRTDVNIPYSMYKLDNGLTVILHEDHHQPLVVVNLNVNVGSRDEVEKRTGFAHLFEHLMFMGTKRVPEKKFDEWMEREGGWNNAWTSEDRTDYFDVGPSHALPLLLWLEADRFAVLGDQIDQEKLDTQRGVVRNERRQQVENQPYEILRLRLPELIFPKGHPYHHPVIGSHEDLEAASVNDVRSFFKTWYIPRNASLVVAGDFDPKTVRATMQRYFGHIPAGKPLPARRTTQPARLDKVIRETLEDNVTAPKVTMVWPSPALYAAGDADLDILSEVLTEGKASRLYKTLVYDKQLAQSVAAYQASHALESYFAVEAIAKPDVPLAEIEKVIDQELARVRKEPMSAQELARARNQYEFGFVARLQSLATRASMLNGYFAERNDPGWAAKDLQRYLDVTPEGVRRWAEKIFDPDKRVIIHVVPRKEKSK
ncbi:MAG TPA: pitrilysin family protein [Polyangiaceae bacterium]|nr:pitrilysin family protein [Polyangiaceae bacterium]